MGPENLLVFTRNPSMTATVNLILRVGFSCFCSSELSVALLNKLRCPLKKKKNKKKTCYIRV